MQTELPGPPTYRAKLYLHGGRSTTSIQILDPQGGLVHGTPMLSPWTLVETVDLETEDEETAMLFASLWNTMVREIGGMVLTIYSSRKRMH